MWLAEGIGRGDVDFSFHQQGPLIGTILGFDPVQTDSIISPLVWCMAGNQIKRHQMVRVLRNAIPNMWLPISFLWHMCHPDSHVIERDWLYLIVKCGVVVLPIASRMWIQCIVQFGGSYPTPYGPPPSTYCIVTGMVENMLHTWFQRFVCSGLFCMPYPWNFIFVIRDKALTNFVRGSLQSCTFCSLVFKRSMILTDCYIS